MSKAEPGLLMVVGSTQASRHVDPNIYSDWSALLIDNEQMLPVSSEWF